MMTIRGRQLSLLGGGVLINPESYPETVVQEAVDDRIDEAVRHGKPMNAVVKRDDECLLKLGFVVEQLRVEVDDDYEDVQGQPTYPEQRHHDHQHLDDLPRSIDHVIGDLGHMIIIIHYFILQ